MKACREYRKVISRVRKRFGKKNGVISAALMDHPDYERKRFNSKKLQIRRLKYEGWLNE